MSLATETKQGMQITTFILVGMIVVFTILFHNTGGIAGLVRVMGVTASVIAIRNPKTGIYLLAFFCFYLDFVKKLAVTFGAQRMSTVMEVLAIQMLVLGCSILGSLIQLLLIDRRFQKAHFYAAVFTGVVTGAAMGMTLRYGLVSAVQSAVNGGLYSGLILVMLALFHTRESVVKLLDFIFYMAIPWALYGTCQSIFGYADFEWAYGRTWFSAISSANMFAVDGPRPFGFASGPQGYGILTQMMNYGIWRAFLGKEVKGGFVLGSLIVLLALITSLQRTILIQPIIFLAVYWAFRNKSTTKLLYGAGISMFILGVSLSPYLHANIESFTAKIQGESGWSAKVLNLNTFSDRLVGWQRLTRASTYTLLGTRFTHGITDDQRRSGGDEYSHDLINNLLDEVGLLGLALLAAAVIPTVSRIHRMTWEIDDPESRALIIFLLATTMIQFGMSATAGSNLSTVPHNFVNWAFFGAAVTLAVQHKKLLTPIYVRESMEPLATYKKQALPFQKKSRHDGL